MKNWSWTLALVSLVVLLAGCGADDSQPQQSAQVLLATEALAPTAEPTAASTPTDVPSPTVEEPEPTVTSLPTTGEPAPTSTPTPTAEPTAAPPTSAPSATPVVVRTVQDIQRLAPAEAKALLDNGKAVLYDVRSAGEYRALHATGALSFPEAEMVARNGELPTDRALVFY